MDGQRTDIGWKEFAVRLIDALRWPAALVAIAWILREPIKTFVAAVIRALT